MLEPGFKVANYEIGALLGDGGTAHVYSCTTENQRYAIKVYRKEFVEGLEVRQRLEILDRIERQLELRGHNNPYLVQVIDGGVCADTDLFYVVMELLGQETLASARATFPSTRIGPVIAQLAHAAEYLESRGIVHRDIKPANIWVSHDRSAIKLLDLGVVRPLKSDLTDDSRLRPFVATLRYSPREFIYREDPNDDQQLRDWYRALSVYQIGTVLYELLTRKQFFHEFGNEAWPHLLRAIETGVPRLRAATGPARLVTLANQSLNRAWRERASLSWDTFLWAERRLIPTIVFLSVGGTIESEKTREGIAPIRGAPKVTRFREFAKDRMTHDYNQLRAHGEAMPFEFRWHSLPGVEPMLSENASIGDWDSLATVIRDLANAYCIAPFHTRSVKWKEIVAPFCNPDQPPLQFMREARTLYVVGIVVLHGTDTLGYAAAALAFALTNLPCPVMLTAANNPSNAHSAEETDLISSQSDAWRNLRRTIEFLEAYGHRCADVFVCFGDTVHHAVNLRKEPILQVPGPSSEANAQVQFSEPFCFRNVGGMAQYMFRWIDGMLCNNFYPTRRFDYRHLSGTGRADRMQKHGRLLSLGDKPPPEAGSLPFCEAVRLIRVGPSMPGIAEFAPKGKRSELKVIMIEGYDSGTFPTQPGHTFTDLLTRFYEGGVPLVLIARNGLIPTKQQYMTFRINNHKVRVIRLFGIIGETALPLVSLVAQSISEARWSPARKTGIALYDHRRRLLERAIRNFEGDNSGVMNWVLGDVLDEDEQRNLIVEQQAREIEEYMRRVHELFGAAQSDSAKPTDEEDNFDRYVADDVRFPQYTTLVRPHYVWMSLESMQPFERMGAGPEAFVAFANLGFIWGRKEFQRRRSEGGPGRAILDAAVDSRAVVSAIDGIIERACFVLFVRGHAEIRMQDHLEEGSRVDCLGRAPRCLRFSVSIVRRASLLRRDELYAVEHMRASDFAWFKQLRDGVAYTTEASKHLEELSKQYRARLLKAWSVQLCPLDWFCLGAFKGMMLEAIRHLKFDQWVWKCLKDDAKSIGMLRSSIEVNVKRADSQRLVLGFRYTEREALPKIR